VPSHLRAAAGSKSSCRKKNEPNRNSRNSWKWANFIPGNPPSGITRAMFCTLVKPSYQLRRSLMVLSQ
jgi:hypothetical protein